MSIYTYREGATSIVGSYGPLTELDDEYHFGGERRLDPTPEQELEAGWCHGPSVSASTVLTTLRALDIDPEQIRTLGEECCGTFDPRELLGRCVMARIVEPLADDGMPSLRSGNFVLCGKRPGFFADMYEQIAVVCEQAIAWGTKVVIA